MQKLSDISLGTNNTWLNIETISVIGSLGGAVASLVSQQVFFVSIPLSLAVTLNLVNRRRLLNQVAQENQTIAQLAQNSQASQKAISARFEQNAQEHQAAIAQLVQQSQDRQTQLATLLKQLEETQDLTSDLSQSTKKLQDSTQNLEYHQKQLEGVVGELRGIESLSQSIQVDPNCAQSYFERGLSYQHLGDKQGAINDYTEAIRLAPGHAKAYYHRGILNVDLGKKKAAVEDLRRAAKFYFEEGDIDNYQKARDMSKQIHELNLRQKLKSPQCIN